MKSPRVYRYQMKEGMMLGRPPNKPALFVIGDGSQAYLWVGNDAEGDSACFATISGSTNLRRIADAILKALNRKLTPQI